MKKSKELGVLSSYIKKHIGNIKKAEDRSNCDIDYSLIEEVVEEITVQYKTSNTKSERKCLKGIIKDVYDILYEYLIKINKYDHRILNEYEILERVVNNRNYAISIFDKQ